MGRGFRLTPNYILFGGCEVTYYVDTNEVYEETIEEGADATQPESFTPTKTGWTFVGWAIDDHPTPSVLDSRIIQEDEETLTLYAKFTDGTQYYSDGNQQNIAQGFSSGRTAYQLYAGIQYKFEVWGAKGGSTSASSGSGTANGYGANGGYSVGYYTPSEDEIVYVGINDGAGPGAYGVGSWPTQSGDNTGNNKNGAPGGGASWIGKVNNTLANNPKADLFIVGAGGGGGYAKSNSSNNQDGIGKEGRNGGAGGGLNGSLPPNASGSQSATQTQGGGCTWKTNYLGSYGKGGRCGGGGLYGGGADGYVYAGGGGSSYVDGVNSGSTTSGTSTAATAKITMVA